MTQQHDPALGRTGSREEWRSARLALLAKEKELNRLRADLAAQRRQLPWVEVT
jgi:predicted dithiol-disulfide oxidoreductase (DUF899 family)